MFYLWRGPPLERWQHVKPYPQPKNTTRIFLLLWASSAREKGKKRIWATCLSFETKMSNQQGQCVSCWHFRNAQAKNPSAQYIWLVSVFNPVGRVWITKCEWKTEPCFFSKLCITGCISLKKNINSERCHTNVLPKKNPGSSFYPGGNFWGKRGFTWLLLIIIFMSV